MTCVILGPSSIEYNIIGIKLYLWNLYQVNITFSAPCPDLEIMWGGCTWSREINEIHFLLSIYLLTQDDTFDIIEGIVYLLYGIKI